MSLQLGGKAEACRVAYVMVAATVHCLSLVVHVNHPLFSISSVIAATVQLLISLLFPLNHNLCLLYLPPEQGGEQFVVFFLVELLN